MLNLGSIIYQNLNLRVAYVKIRNYFITTNYILST